jgi:hypothetical protein
MTDEQVALAAFSFGTESRRLRTTECPMKGRTNRAATAGLFGDIHDVEPPRM